LIDGEIWTKTNNNQKEYDKELCRDMAKCFKDGQSIRHIIKPDKEWIGTYNSLEKGIIYKEKCYKYLSTFTQEHYSAVRKDRCKQSNGWKECECEVDGKWISTFNLPY